MVKGSTQKDTLTLPQNKPSEAIKESAAESVVAAPSGPSIKDIAAAEEALSAQRALQIKAMQEQAQAAMEVEEEPLVSVAARGRDHLMQKLREHSEKQAAKAAEERPKPVISAKMQEKIDAEIEAGRRAQAKHQEQWDNRPVRQPEIWDGKNEVVARANNLVPDPAKGAHHTSVSGNFVGGHRQYGSEV